MFDHIHFDKYKFDEIPLGRDMYLVDEMYMKEWEQAQLGFFNGSEYRQVGFVCFIIARKINKNSIEMSWYINIHDRYHVITISIPKDQIITCVGSEHWDEKPHVFVKSDWLDALLMRSFSVFAMVDAIGVKKALENGELSRDKLLLLRSKIDSLSEIHPDISFISFADSLLLKSNWSAGYFKRELEYTYNPEIFIYLAKEINQIFQSTLGLETYTIITQGNNEYYDDDLLHFSKTKNHISLNSLGLPFAQLLDIDNAVRKAINLTIHPPGELYLDEKYYFSLKFKFGFEKNSEPNSTYESKMSDSPCKYYYPKISTVLSNLKVSDTD